MWSLYYLSLCTSKPLKAISKGIRVTEWKNSEGIKLCYQNLTLKTLAASARKTLVVAIKKQENFGCGNKKTNMVNKGAKKVLDLPEP